MAGNSSDNLAEIPWAIEKLIQIEEPLLTMSKTYAVVSEVSDRDAHEGRGRRQDHFDCGNYTQNGLEEKS